MMLAHTHICSKRGRRVLRGLAAAGAILLWAGNAQGLADGQLELFASHTITRDDNVFRLSEQSDAAAVLGSPSKSDTNRSTAVGLNFDVPLGRQRVEGGLWFNDNRFDEFTILDFTERHGRTTWHWHVGDALSGRLGGTSDRALASLANVQGGVQLATPNAIDTRKAFVDAAWLVTPRWKLRGEANRLEQGNSVAERTVNDIISDGVGLEVSRISPAGNQIGLAVQRQDATLAFLQPVPGVGLVDNSYRQHRVRLVTEWTLTGHSRLSASAGRVSRRFAELPERDHATGIFNATFEWKPTARFTLHATAQRDISAPDEINAGVNVGFVLAESIILRPSFRLSDKFTVSGGIGWSDWEYLGDPGLARGTLPPRHDRVRNAALTLTYQAMRILRLEMALRRETRSSTAAFGDYEADIASLSARLAF